MPAHSGMPPRRQGGQRAAERGTHATPCGAGRNEASGTLARRLPRTRLDLQRHGQVAMTALSWRMAAFRGEVAIVINQLSKRMRDCLMVSLRGRRRRL